MLFGFGCIIALVLLPGTLDLLLVTIGAFFPRKQRSEGRGDLGSVAFVVPAHNEGKSIRECLNSLQGLEGDAHILVVADNCDDETAFIARDMGVEVLERSSETHKGKPYALSAAFDNLLKREFEWFIVVDADTSVSPDFLKNISREMCLSGVKAVQGRYLIRNSGESRRTRLMNVAFFSQYLRMRGKGRLGLSTGIQGNGFVLHRDVVKHVPMKGEYIAEDLAYHLELVMNGVIVRYSENAEVFADMPVSSEGIKSQRSRWEGGRFRVARDYIPRLFRQFTRGNYYCLEPLFDLLLLPLGYHLFGILLLMIVTGFSWLSWIYLFVPVVHVILSIILGGGTAKDIWVLMTVPYYMFWKILNLGSVVKNSKKDTSWVRTDRES